MPAPKVLPTSDVLVSLRQQGWTYEDIATAYGVTKGAVYLALRQAKVTKDRPSHKDLLPWTVKGEHAHARPAAMLRLLGRRRAGMEIALPKARMLDKWLREVEAADVVVCYDPEQPPNPASPSTGGWYYSRRRPEDGTFPESIIRYEEDRDTYRPKNQHQKARRAG